MKKDIKITAKEKQLSGNASKTVVLQMPIQRKKIIANEFSCHVSVN